MVLCKGIVIAGRTMALRIVRTKEEQLVSGPVVAALTQALNSRGHALLLVPSYGQQLTALQGLAAGGVPTLGIAAATPLSWAQDSWGVWGDGRRTVAPVARRILMRQALEQADANELEGLCANPGTITVLCELAKQALPWLDAAASASLTKAERAAIRVVQRYAAMLEERGLIEASEMLVCLVDAMASAGAVFPPVVVAGFSALNRAQRELMLALACKTDVMLVLGALGAEAAARAERLSALLGVDFEGEVLPADPMDRSKELDRLLRFLFTAGGEAVAPTGAVSLLAPAGPLAEAELVAREVVHLAGRGHTDIVLGAADPGRMWRELAPKLRARGVSCSAMLSRSVLKLPAGRAFFEFAQAVAYLDALAREWPEPKKVEEGLVLGVGPMDWWPPSDLVDFLLNDISNVPTASAYRLDRQWRSDRLLSPADVLGTLQNPKATSPEVAAATRELLKGRLGSAASRLLAPYAGGSHGKRLDDEIAGDDGSALVQTARPQCALSDGEAEGVLTAVLGVAGTLKELGISADPKTEGAVSLERLVFLAEDALLQAKLVLRPAVDAGEKPLACVRIVAASRVANLGPCAADAVVLCGQTSVESPVGAGDDVLTALLVALGVEPAQDQLSNARQAFAQSVGVARRELVVERTVFDASSKECYPSVMLTELMACYGLDSDEAATALGIARRELGESAAEANEAPSGVPSELVGVQAIGRTGEVGLSARPLVVVPPPGRIDLLDGKPILSASQLESYLECPYKWFSLRRLGLANCDAGFSPMEMGTFVHRVLEVTHRALFDGALEAAGLAPDAEFDLARRLPGSRISLDDEPGLERARRVLEQAFEENCALQYVRAGKRTRSQALVPHTIEDEGALGILRKDLLSTLDYEAGLFEGYEPRLFEWSFGRKGERVEYAGAWLNGTIDRVDVDAHGQAVVIDYKHKGAAGFVREYAAMPAGDDEVSDFVLPRRVQSLVYGQVVRRRYPDLKLRAAVYLGTKGNHALAGAVSANALDRIYGAHPLGGRSAGAVTVDDAQGFDGQGARGIEGLLDATEAAIAQKVAELVEGNVEANPIDAKACSFCPVMNCEKRMNA